MKGKHFIVLILLPFLFGFSSTSKDEDCAKIKMYMVRWDAKYSSAITIENIQKRYAYYFEKDCSDFLLDPDYKDCAGILEEQPLVAGEVDNTAKVWVEFYFGRKKIEAFFKSNGTYYFEGKWHQMNSCLYYKLFYHFSNELIPAETLERAKGEIDELPNKRCAW